MGGNVLEIRWERLLVEGETCPRCSETEEELEKAVASLRELLSPLGVKVVLKKEEITREAFEKDPLRSNSIFINGRLLEEYIGAKVGKSPCCDVCGPMDCRTIELEDITYEAVPAALIVKAALMALSAGTTGCCGPSSCCS